MGKDTRPLAPKQHTSYPSFLKLLQKSLLRLFHVIAPSLVPVPGGTTEDSHSVISGSHLPTGIGAQNLLLVAPFLHPQDRLGHARGPNQPLDPGGSSCKVMLHLCEEEPGGCLIGAFKLLESLHLTLPTPSFAEALPWASPQLPHHPSPSYPAL